jgi:hypothetical protein
MWVFRSLVIELIGFWWRVVVLLFHSALGFMHLELFWLRVLIPCAPVIGVLSFFSWSSSSVPQTGLWCSCYVGDCLFYPLS